MEHVKQGSIHLEGYFWPGCSQGILSVESLLSCWISSQSSYATPAFFLMCVSCLLLTPLSTCVTLCPWLWANWFHMLWGSMSDHVLFLAYGLWFSILSWLWKELTELPFWNGNPFKQTMYNTHKHFKNYWALINHFQSIRCMNYEGFRSQQIKSETTIHNCKNTF